MSAAAVELIGRAALGHPIPESLTEDVDPIDLALMIADFCTWPAFPGAAEILHKPQSAEAGGLPTATVDNAVPPVLLVLAVLRGDPSALDMAANVHPVALALLALIVLEWPAVADPEPWLERLALAERGDL